MSTQAYTKNGSRDSAVVTLRSWLNAVNIQHANSTTPGCDITVQAKDGSTFEVAVLLGRAKGQPLAKGVVVVRAEELRCARLSRTHQENPTSSPLQIALNAFHLVTERAGHGRILPFNRGSEPDRMFSFEEDGFLVPLRHTEFRRAPDPAPAKYKLYKDVLERGAYMFYASNTGLCERHVHSLEDIQNYARFLLAGFCAHYERPNPIEYTNDGNENHKLLAAYLKQRLSELRKSWLTRFLAQVPDGMEIVIHSVDDNGVDHAGRALARGGHFGELDDYREAMLSETDSVEAHLDAVSTDEAHPLTTDDDEERQQERSREQLRAALASMPHAQMVETLVTISNNEDMDDETRKAAARQLLLHSRRCQKCSGKGAKVKEEATGVDAGSAQE